MPSKRRAVRLPKLPDLVEQKLTKTGYTRGASVREIYQNRVTRNNPALISLEDWPRCRLPDDGSGAYQNGFIVLVEPSWYFETADADKELAASGLELGRNALLLYRRRFEWENYRPSSGKLPNGKPFNPGTSRIEPLGGVYLARVHATVSDDGTQISEGYNNTRLRGAGIRVYEYASAKTIAATKLQLEALTWLCHDAEEQMQLAGMSAHDVQTRRKAQLERAERDGLLDLERLRTLRLIGDDNATICPLCRVSMSAGQFLQRTIQAEGRTTYDLTTTEVSLFHVQELRVGKLQHKIYNLGWGHHHCNVVVKDAGIMPTLKWMQQVLDNQPRVEDLDQEAASVEEAVDG